MSHYKIVNKEPLKIEKGIKIFSQEDKYTQNYEEISIEHFESIKEGIANPFIEEKIWEEMEISTIELINKYINQGNIILDVGVGHGRLLSKIDIDVKKFGIDISLHNLLESKKKGIDVCMAKAEELPFNENCFDIVVCTDVLEHALDINTVFNEIKRVLKPQGKFIVRVPYREDLSLYSNHNYPYFYSHIRNFDEYSLKLISEKVFNFKLLDTSYTTYLPIANKLKCQRNKLENKIMWRILKTIKTIHEKTYNCIAPYFLYPVEMNMVFEKND